MSLPPGQRDPDHRIERTCHSCKYLDDHPMHIVVNSFDEVVYKHFDCCRNDGCPNGHCDAVLLEAHGARGEELIGFLKQKHGVA